MNPFLYLHLAPQFHFPFSGAVSQAIDPDVTWFQNLIRPGAGDARIEQRAFAEVASYGKQLGLITDVLLEQAGRAAGTGTESESVRKLRDMRARIDGIKAEEYGQAGGQVDAALVARLIQALQHWGPGPAALPALEAQAREVAQ